MADHMSLRQLCCKGLTVLLGAKNVLLPGSAGYNESLSSYFSPQASSVHPLCFVTPQSSSDVSKVVSTLAHSGICNFAVRSGGHTWFPGAANAPSGVTIDLRGLDSIKVHTQNSSVSIGAGATWDVVYSKLETYGLSAVGGRVLGVGVGGLTLGGGISFFGPRYGWACNQALLYEVVLANGSIVEASESHNADLWWGLRGGSNNFGVVTKVILAAFEQGPLWTTTTDNTLASVNDQVSIYSRIMQSQNYDENASYLFGWGISQPLNQTVPITLNQLVYTKPQGNSTPEYFQDIVNLPNLAPLQAAVVNMSTIAVAGAAAQPPQVLQYFTATITYVPTKEMLLATFNAYNNSVASIQNLKGVTWTVIIEPLPPQIYARGATKNALGLADNTQSLAVCLVSVSWVDPSQNNQIYDLSRGLLDTIEKEAKRLGAFDPYIYLNYAAPWQDVIASYGRESVSRLQKLQAEVDPHKIFQRLVPGGFKIPC
uniref:Bifunctional solanapyrone synthase n=1 Tax=Talaromyces marneffei PM1 TaxID=1077442 RepID=A0A093X899_TALMA